MQIIIWGAGQKLQKNIDKIPFHEVVCLIDKDKKKQGNILCGKSIVSPEKLPSLKYDYIVISSILYFEEIARQLLFQYGVECKKIMSLNVFLREKRVLETALTQRIKKLCNGYGIHKVLDIGGILLKNNFWNIERKLSVDTLVQEEEQQDFLIKKYRNIFISPDDLTERYNLIIDASHCDERAAIHKIGNLPYMVRLYSGMERWNEKEILNITGTNFNVVGIPVEVINKKKKNVCIYQVTHKEFVPVVGVPYKPIYVGRTDKAGKGYLRETEGDNISEFNDKINECTALYWIWKNDITDYIGLNHYRRLFRSAVNSNWMLQDFEVQLLMEQYDIVVAEEYYTGEISVLQHLESQVCKEAFQRTYKAITDIFVKIGGTDYQAFQYVMAGYMLYPCNMFITSRKILEEYCAWLFPILFQMIEKVEIQKEWDNNSKRVIGYFAERLLTVWLVQHEYKIKELPILFLDMDTD